MTPADFARLLIAAVIVGCSGARGDGGASQDATPRRSVIRFVEPDSILVPGQIHLTVVDAETGERLSGVEICAATNPPRSVITDRDGLARLDSLRPRPLGVIVRATEYSDAESLFNAGMRGRRQATVQMVRGTGTADGTYSCLAH